MLAFFRRYQKFFYIAITVVIVISFSFFGTSGALGQKEILDGPAFTAIDGRAVKRSELERMVLFLQTDIDDKRNLGGVWGPNFLNDGLVAKDILESGIASQILERFKDSLADDLSQRRHREQSFRTYVHPGAAFLSAELVWSYFVPDLKAAYDRLRQAEDPVGHEALDARIQLYLQERKFPSSSLRQVLRYQERQYEWLKVDPRLSREDLSLFHYHTVEDWFGSRFLHLVAQYVINGATLAEQKGYRVSTDEALVDLMRMNDRSFQEFAQNPNLGVTNSRDYFREQARRMRLGESQIVKLWQQILLFRRLYNDVGNAIFVDSLTYDQFASFANRAVEVEAYVLPDALRLKNFSDLQKFETYVAAVRGEEALGDPLLLPRSIKDATELSQDFPELVQKRYLLNFSEVDKRALQAKAGVRATWDWQVSDSGWVLMKERFPELGMLLADTSDDRYAALETLDARSRAQADTFAREQVVEAHPEWLEVALESTKPKTIELGVRLAGGKLPILGVQDRKALMELLDRAPLGTQDDQTYAEALKRYSPDGRHYYRIQVLERGQGLEVLTFSEADELNVLAELTDHSLQKHYEAIRDADSETYRKEDGTWKLLTEVRRDVASDLFGDVLSAIERYESSRVGKDLTLSKDLAASRRLKRYMDAVQAEADVDVEAYVYHLPEKGDEDLDSTHLSDRVLAVDQWKLWKNVRKVYRSQAQDVAGEDLFELSDADWSSVHAPADGSLSFYKILAQVDSAANGSKTVRMDDGYHLLGAEAKASLSEAVLDLIGERKAMDVSYLRH